MNLKRKFLNELIDKLRAAEAGYPSQYRFPLEYYMEDDRLTLCFENDEDKKPERIVMIFKLDKIIIEGD